MQKATRQFRWLVMGGVLSIVAAVVSLAFGRYAIPPAQVAGMLRMVLAGLPQEAAQDSALRVFLYIRIPRVLMAYLVGAGLAGAGTLFQGVFRNPLVSPDILGVTSGCALGAAIGILSPFEGPWVVPLSAFAMGIAAMILAYLIARAARGEPVIMLVLSGTIVAAFFSAGLSLVKYLADPYDQLPAIVFWTMGGLFRANWEYVLRLAAVSLPCLAVICLLGWKIDIMSLGDDEARALGVNVRLLRVVVVTLATAVVAASISVAGTVAWVGLVVPHITRLLMGPGNALGLPMSAIAGGIFVLLIDNIARTVTAGEIPVSILTAAVGAPFFAYLLIRRYGGAWNG